eukprot:4169983-Pyramimonas_sp.AAC.1
MHRSASGLRPERILGSPGKLGIYAQTACRAFLVDYTLHGKTALHRGCSEGVPPSTAVTRSRNDSGHAMPGNECPLVALIHSGGTSSLSHVH